MKPREPGRSMKIDEEVLDRVAVLAQRERRTIKAQVAYLLEIGLQQHGRRRP